MIRKMIAVLMALVLAASLAACGGNEETTLTGMVVSVDGTVISLMEMDTANMGDMEFAEGERPTMPEGMEDFGGFTPGDFDGTLPEGETMPQWGTGDMPEGMEFPEGMTMPENGEMPEGMEPPEGMTMPENGEMPDFGGENGGKGPGFGNLGENVETTEVDIADAHISVEIDGGKASGSLEDIVPGAFVTITMSGKGEATYVLVSAQSGFSGRFTWGSN